MDVIRCASVAVGTLGIGLWPWTGAIAEAQGRVLDKVTVTAQKKTEDVSSVPVAVSSFDGEDLLALSIEDPLDLAGQTPGLSTAMNSVGAPSFSIRGVGLEDFIGNNVSGTAGIVRRTWLEPRSLKALPCWPWPSHPSGISKRRPKSFVWR